MVWKTETHFVKGILHKFDSKVRKLYHSAKLKLLIGVHTFLSNISAVFLIHTYLIVWIFHLRFNQLREILSEVQSQILALPSDITKTNKHSNKTERENFFYICVHFNCVEPSNHFLVNEKCAKKPFKRYYLKQLSSIPNLNQKTTNKKER